MNRTILMVAGAFGASSLLLADSAVKGTALLVLAATAALILRRDSAATRHLVWLLAIVALLVVPVLSALLPQWRVLPEWAAVSSPPVGRQDLRPELSRVLPPPIAELPEDAKRAELEPYSPAVDRAAAELPDPRPAPATPGIIPAPAVWNRLNALPLVWVIGFSVLIVRLMAARMLLWRYEWCGTILSSSRESPTRPARGQPTKAGHDPLVTALDDACRRLGIRRPVTLSIHPDRTIPVVWGIFRCHLLLPAAARQWSSEQLRSVLLHELAHVRRCDMLTQLLTQLAGALHWFNPLVWFAAWRLGVERERACDDLVLASGVRPSAYAGHLLDVVTGLAPARWTQTCGLAMARRSSLEGRLVAVLSQDLNRRGVSAAVAAIALAVGAAIAVPVAMLRAANNAPVQDEKAASPKTIDSAAEADSPPGASPKDDQSAVMKPRHESGQRLFKIWQDNARTDGKIPGGALRSLAEAVTKFIKLNPTHERVPQLTEFLKRIDTSHDWKPAEAVALLDDLTAIYATLPDWAGSESQFSPGGPIRSGQPLPAELAGAAWGRPAANGLRAAWVFDPGGGTYPLGTSLKARILFHNSGTKTVIFRTPDWHQYGNHEARDANGKAIPISAVEWTRLGRLETIRLARGEYAEAEAHGIGIGPDNRHEVQWAEVRVGAWVEAKAGDEVAFQPGAVTASGDNWTPPAEHKTPAKMWWAIVRGRLDREGPMPSAAADREQLIRRVMPDLIGVTPTKEEVAAFVADNSSDPLTALANRLVPRIAPFAGVLPTGEIKFRVTAADPDAATRPRVATGPGRYVIGNHVRLVIEQKPDGNLRANEARIVFFPTEQKAEPGNPHAIKLPYGHLTWAIAWERGTTVLWVTQKGLVRKIDFADPADVKETRFEDGGIVNVPQQLRDAFRKAFDVPGAPVQQQESQKPKEGTNRDPDAAKKP
jgi:hypothetical protein